MSCVKNHQSYDIWRGKRTIQKPESWDALKSLILRGGSETNQDGILAFATAHEQVLVPNWNAGDQVPLPGNDLSNM